MNGKKHARHQKSKQSFETKIMKSRIHWHQRNWYEMKAEIFTFQSTYVSLHTNSHGLWNINFKRRWKFDGTGVFFAIQTTGCINLNAPLNIFNSLALFFYKLMKQSTISLLIQLMLSLNITLMKIFDLSLYLGLHMSL